MSSSPAPISQPDQNTDRGDAGSDGATALAAGSVFQGRYQIVRCINAGGMGAVYEAVHLETRRRRALKVMLPSIVANSDMRARFKLEATIAADIESEHIVETFDAGVDSETGSPFLVMELLRGEDLGTFLDRRGAVPAAEVVAILAQVAVALDKTHLAGVVHRDLKPENLFVTHRDDGTPRIKILDFGIAKYVAQNAQNAKQTASVGTPLFMAPEQIRGDGAIGPAADNYALAHIAYALLTGDAYWSTEAAELDGVYPLLVKVMEGLAHSAVVRAAERGVSLPLSFDAWFERATSLAPDERPATASLVVESLAECFGLPAPRLSMPTGPTSPRNGVPAVHDAETIQSSPLGVSPAASSGPAPTPTPTPAASRTTAGVTGEARAAAAAVARSSSRRSAALGLSLVGAGAVLLVLWLGGGETKSPPSTPSASGAAAAVDESDPASTAGIGVPPPATVEAPPEAPAPRAAAAPTSSAAAQTSAAPAQSPAHRPRSKPAVAAAPPPAPARPPATAAAPTPTNPIGTGMY